MRRFVCSLVVLSLTVVAVSAEDAKLNLKLRSLVPSKDDANKYDRVTKDESWDAAKTAIIVCDMWDTHHCYNAVKRVEELAPRMNKVLEKARSMGVFIIHAPSSCMKPYDATAARKRAKDAPKAASLPKEIDQWCRFIPSEAKEKYPIDQSDGGCDSEPTAEKAHHAKLTAMGRNYKAPWMSQIDVLKIHDDVDAISDSGVEIWNLLESRGISNVILLGVHTNMCVLGRPFGLRQMAKNGKHVVLMRDMTDTMYNPAQWPNVSHFEGTARIVDHIEKFVCPTVSSEQVVGGEPFRFKDDVAK